MNLTVRLFSFLLLVTSLQGFGQNFSEEPEAFSGEAIEFMRSFNTEAAYQVSNKFVTAWSSWTQDQKNTIVELGIEMSQKGHSRTTFFNYFAYLSFAVTQENLTSEEMTKVLEVNKEVLAGRSKGEYAEFVHGLNFFFARRYLAFKRTIKTQALEGSYEFKVINSNPDAFYSDSGEEFSLDSLTAGDPFAGDTTLVSDQDKAPGEEDDPWAIDPSDDPWAIDPADDPWGDSSNADDTWGDSSQTDDTWGGDTSGGYTAPKPIQNRPEVELPIKRDYVEEMRSNYYFPADDGPIISLTGVKIFIETPYDSLSITDVEGNFLLKNRVFAGKTGSLAWPQIHDRMDNARLELGEWYFKVDHNYLSTPNAKLIFHRFSEEPIEGKFTFSSQRRQPGTGGDFPIFASNYADISVDLSETAKYSGGLEVRGNKFIGRAISRDNGTLELTAASGNRVTITAQEFILGDSSMTTKNGSISIIHGSDTIFHPSASVWYDVASEELVILRNKWSNTNTFKSTYFGMELNADLVKWDMKRDSIQFDVMNGKSEIPMTVESDKYFEMERYTRMNPIFQIHPLVMAIVYSRKFGDIREFNHMELAEEFKLEINTVRAEMKILEQYGFIDYDHSSGQITLKEKAIHNFKAAAKEEDYDHIYISSQITNLPNAILNLDSGHLVINGVSSFSVVEGYDLEIEPDSSKQVTLLKNKGFRVSGTITEGDFIYNGKDFTFNYDEFLISMPQIDSMRLNVSLVDSTDVENIHTEKTTLNNSITSTTGTLFIEEPHHKAGHEQNDAYPYFVTDSDALVYFDGSEILNGAYDRSVFFVIPPFKVDSIDRDEGVSFEFDGKFVSGGIFPDFQQVLTIQPDQSLGFTHQIPNEGYPLYGTEARTYEQIKLSNQGIRGGGQIDFLTTQVFSDDFIYYPDSVSANGSGGRIQPGSYKGASFPEAILGAYDMYWLPRKDSMYLHTVNEPFIFYNATAELEGFANITTNGVYGGGTLLTRGSKSISSELNFEEKAYSARHAKFEIQTDDPTKPAMAGDDIDLEFDLVKNTAVIRPEKRGTDALSFPYAQIRTSITEATWDLEDSVVTMTKPAAVAIEDSYFYSSREELDSLVFSGDRAIYDINTFELKVEGIPYITVADSRIIPEGNTTTIYANSRLEEFKNAEIIIDTLNGFHHLTKGQITVISRNKFQGSAFYLVAVESDTFQVRFDSFELTDVQISPKETRQMTVSGGEVTESQNLKIAPGFFYKGSVQMFAYKEALELSGSVRMDVQNISNSDLWIPYERRDSSVHPHIPLANAIFEDGTQGIAGLQMNIKGDLYTTFVEKRINSSDLDFLRVDGELSYNHLNGNYKIETPAKTNGAFAGYTLLYNDTTSNIFVEGPASFFKPTTSDIQVKAAVSGTGNKNTNEYTLDSFITLNFNAHVTILDEMGASILETIEILGASTANDATEELLFKLANIVGNSNAIRYQENQQDGYESLLSVSRELEKSVVISGVKMKWAEKHRAWHNTTKIGLSHVGREDINAKLDGFLEFRRDDTGADEMNLFIQASPEVWYFISYQEKNLLMFSSNTIFNQLVEERSNLGKEKAGELLFAVGDTNETLGFINRFRKSYFGIDQPYNLFFPEAILEDENFDTIEKEEEGVDENTEEEEEDDDGF
ncbi:MAG: hypothetical protein GY816_03540 [Cytophagales bacterium]|nr:hypothetical protein [Cytophagales bacterium]